MFQLFDRVGDVKMQIKKKRREIEQNGFQAIFGGGGHQTQNNGWGQQGSGNGWGQQPDNGWGQQGGNNGWNGDDSPIAMALYANRNLWGNDLDGKAWVNEQKMRQASRIFNPHQGSPFNMSEFGQFIEQQITFLEPSPAEQRLKELERTGKTFYDDRFPPNQTSLSGEWGRVSEWNSI